MQKSTPYSETRILRCSLRHAFDWFVSLHHHPIKDKMGKICYEYHIDSDQTVFRSCPIRELGVLECMSTLGRLRKRADLLQLVRHCLHKFAHPELLRDVPEQSTAAPHLHRALPQQQGRAIRFSERAINGEPPNIAHSAMMILALMEGSQYQEEFADMKGAYSKEVDAWRQLAHSFGRGILAQQRDTDPSLHGSYKVHFPPFIQRDSGMELYAGEAMLALMKLHESEGREESEFLESVEQALPFYMRYMDRGKVSDDVFVFFANWQTQAAVQCHRFTKNEELKQRIEDFIFTMHDSIISSGFYLDLGENTFSVRVACALEGLADAYALLLQPNRLQMGKKDGSARGLKERQGRYEKAIGESLSFLLRMQTTNQHRAFGGIAHSMKSDVQRLDVTGHAVSAMTKLLHLSEKQEKEGHKYTWSNELRVSDKNMGAIVQREMSHA